MEKVYTIEEIQSLLANLDNGITKPDEAEMRTKLPIPKEYGGGYVTGNSAEEAARMLIERVKYKLPTTPDDILFKDCADRWILIKMGEMLLNNDLGENYINTHIELSILMTSLRVYEFETRKENGKWGFKYKIMILRKRTNTS